MDIEKISQKYTQLYCNKCNTKVLNNVKSFYTNSECTLIMQNGEESNENLIKFGTVRLKHNEIQLHMYTLARMETRLKYYVYNNIQ